MEQHTRGNYSTATSLTARHINRRIILDIICRMQPISRADTARETGLQRSTVSLIVDELIRDGWVVEGEHGRIPRGRRPIFLQLNAAACGLYSVLIRGTQVELSASDLNGECLWTGQEEMAEPSMQSLAAALQKLQTRSKDHVKHQMKGVGVAVQGFGASLSSLRAAVSELFGLPAACGSIALACAKWFLLHHKDAAESRNHLLSLHVDTTDITMGAVIGGKPLNGAHGRAVNLLQSPAGAPLSAVCGARAAASASPENAAGVHLTEECADRLAEAVTRGVAAYDPGVILVAGNFATEPGILEERLASDLKAMDAADTRIRLINTAGEGQQIYRRGAMGLIWSVFLEGASQ